MAGAVSSTRAAWSKDEEVAAHSSREPGLEARRQGTPIPVVQLVTAALISYLGSRPSDAVRTCTHSKHTAISMHMHWSMHNHTHPCHRWCLLSIFIPPLGLGRSYWVLLYSSLSVFTETVQCRRSLPILIASAPDLSVVWDITMLSCDAEWFFNVVLVLALVYFLFFFYFGLKFINRCHINDNNLFCWNMSTSLLVLEFYHVTTLKTGWWHHARRRLLSTRVAMTSGSELVSLCQLLEM